MFGQIEKFKDYFFFKKKDECPGNLARLLSLISPPTFSGWLMTSPQVVGMQIELIKSFGVMVFWLGDFITTIRRICCINRVEIPWKRQRNRPFFAILSYLLCFCYAIFDSRFIIKCQGSSNKHKGDTIL
jgi:hypothetical protein